MPQRTNGSTNGGDSGQQRFEATSSGSKGGFGRRSYLRLAGAALAGAATLGSSVGSAAAAVSGEIDASEASGTLEVGSGDSVQIHVGSNSHGDYGDLKNVVVDITADGADAIITTHGGNWAIENVGVNGESNGGLSGRPMIAAQTDGSARIENVYLGDGGDHGGHGPGRAGIHVSKDHSGTLSINRLHVANWTDNGVYGSSPGKSGGGGGAVQIERSYGENNNIANFRLGTSGSSLTDSVSVTEGSQHDLNLSRGVWCRRADGIVIEDTDIDISGPAAAPAVVASNGGSAVLRNCEYASTDNRELSGDVSTSGSGTDPSTSPPSGVPMSAEDAAGSAGSTGNTSDGVTADDEGSDDESSPEDEDAESDGNGDNEETSEPETETDDETGADSTDSEDDSETGASDADSDSGSSGGDRSLVVEGTGSTSNGPRTYEFTVEDGSITDKEGNADDSVSGDGSEVQGKVWAPFTDRYSFSGELASFDADGSVEVRVDGETVDTGSL